MGEEMDLRGACCSVGDIVATEIGHCWVAEVLEQGIELGGKVNGNQYCKSGERAYISVCRITTSGQILKRSPLYMGQNWEHLKSEVSDD